MPYTEEKRRHGEDALAAHHEAKALMDANPVGKRSDDVEKQINAWLAKFDANKREIEHYQALEAQEKALNEPDPSNRLNVRSGGSLAASTNISEHAQAFSKALRHGKTALNATEEKALAVSDSTLGGFLIAPQEFSDQLIRDVDDLIAIADIATTMTLENALSLGVPTLDQRMSDATWTTELGPISADAQLAFGKRELKPHPLRKRALISKSLIARVASADALVRQELAYTLAITQEKGFMTGDGVDKPLGLFVNSTNGISNARDVTAAGASAITGDDMIKTLHSVKPQYWAKAQWLFHRDILQALRKLKDNNGQYLWQVGGLAGTIPETFLNKPIKLSEYAPNAISTGQYTALFGDFSFYWIVRSAVIPVQVLDQLYAESNQNGYIAQVEADAMPVKEQPFARLKQA